MEYYYDWGTFSYPEKGKKIDEKDRHSEYIVKTVTRPTEIQMMFYEYALNFKNAAHIIALYLVEMEHPDISKLDTYVFSLAFLYRHSLELMLKAIAFKGIIDNVQRAGFVKDTFHNLEEILKGIEDIAPSTRPSKEIEWLHNYLVDLTQMDKESDSFRYPFHIYWEEDSWVGIGKFKIKRVFEEQTHIDLIKFFNKFEAAYEILENWFLDEEGEAVEWIELAPVFIEEGGAYYDQAVVGYKYGGEDFYPYTKAYLETANYLKRYMREELQEEEERSKLFLPMCYLYRNCVELTLKSTWYSETNEDFQKRCDVMLNKKHSIVGMWRALKPYTIEVINAEELDLLEDYCNQLQGLDSDASKFRYPVQKNMKLYFPTNKRFDFWNTGIFLEAINNALDEVKGMLNQKNEIEAELQREMQSMYGEY